jgi:triacylglycerol lipase
MAQATIILAHGVLGFGSFAGLPMPVNYFNGVADHLRRQGLNVIAPQVNPIGSVQERGEQLAAAILSQAPPAERVHVIAHSMGGLDARYALAHVAGFDDRVATLVTIGTPHRGSTVADAIADPTDPLFEHIPALLRQQLELNAGALHDLTTTVCIVFDAATPDSDGVRYIEVAGDASQGGQELLLFELAALIGSMKGEVNDGVVTKSSALRVGHEHLDDWPVDHAGEIGWTKSTLLTGGIQLPFEPPPPHLARYDAIVKIL